MDNFQLGEKQINKTPRFLFAILLAFSCLLFPSTAFAETRAEYDVVIAKAQAKISAAQDALVVAQDAYQAAVNDKATVDATVQINKTVLDNMMSNVQSKELLLTKAHAALDLAQTQYDTQLISDANWVRPTKEQVQTIEVPYTVQVPYTQLVPRTELVPRTILVPHTEIQSYLDYEAVEVTTVVPGGLTATSYDRQGWNNAPPLPTDTETPLASMNVPNIDYQWFSGLVLNSGKSEDVLVKFEGNLMVPEDNWYSFYAPGDDGIKLKIAGMPLINDWRDKGGGGTTSEPMWIRAGIFYPTTLYYYENGGGAWVKLYSQVAGGNMEVVPATWFGETTVTETIYQPVVRYQEVIVYTEETVFDEVIFFDEVTLFREETRIKEEEIIVVVPDEDATAPLIKNPELLPAVVDASGKATSAEESLTTATKNQADAKEDYDTSVVTQTEKASIIEVASLGVISKQEELVVAQQELDSIPPYKEPTPTPETTTEPTKEPTPVEPDPIPETDPTTTPESNQPELPVDVTTVDAQSLSTEQVAELISVANEILNNSEQGSPEYEQALTALFVAAQADDIVISEELAAIPGAEALVGAINFLGNAGADMSPKVRAESKKIVVTAIVAVGAAVNAATGAALMASPSAGGAPSSGSSSTGYRRRKD